MDYTAKYNELKSVFDLGKDFIDLEDDIQIFNLEFQSNHFTHSNLSGDENNYDNSYFANTTDKNIGENNRFVFPVFVPKCKSQHNSAIILLHGLNERSWLKYLVWANYLCISTCRPVILFPISFHMNRTPAEWSSPRAMLPHLELRKGRIRDLNTSTLANIALSERLSENPLRFLMSGFQSADDITTLIKNIKASKYPFLADICRIDLFAYSIGAYLSQILMLANPNRYFDNTRLFMFCGGALFCDMNGKSRYIMDNAANERLHSYYLDELGKEVKNKGQLSDFILSTKLGQAFWSMLKFDNFKKFRESEFWKIGNRIQAIALKKDLVIPAAAIINALLPKYRTTKSNVEVLDFPYSYCHEAPFPVNNALIANLVDRSFSEVFKRVALFFNQN